MIEIGTKFIRRNNKRKDIETVIDIYITKNSKGETVLIRYVASHDFMGQTIVDYDIAESTIMRSEIIK